MLKTILIGNLGGDPVQRQIPSGDTVVSFRVAVSNGRDRAPTWVKITVWEKLGELCLKYLRKGSLVYVEGKLTTRKWQDQNGQDRYTTEIRADRVQFLDRRNSNGEDGAMDGGMGYTPQRFQQPQRQGGAPMRQQASRRPAPQQDSYEDLGPAFPSEASTMDDIPF